MIYYISWNTVLTYYWFIAIFLSLLFFDDYSYVMTVANNLYMGFLVYVFGYNNIDGLF
jgi:hypothetical protein